MEHSKDGQDGEKDLESQELPINANNSSSSEVKAGPEGSVRAWKRSLEKKENESGKTAEVIQAQKQAEDFWRKIYNTMKNVESKDQAETLFKDLSSSKKTDGSPAKIESQGEWQGSDQESLKAAELRAREKALATEGFVDVRVDTNTPEMFPYIAKKLDEEPSVPDEKYLRRRRRRKCFCCSTTRLWCALMLIIPILVVFLVLYFVLLTPKDPTTSMNDVVISEFKFIDRNEGSPIMETAMNFTVQLKNPNRFADVIYERLDVILTYRSTAIGLATVGIAGYKQQEKNSTLIEAQLLKNSVSIEDAQDAEELKYEVSAENVKMELRGIAEGYFKIGRIKMGSFDTPVRCVLNIRPETSTLPAVLLSASCYNRAK